MNRKSQLFSSIFIGLIVLSLQAYTYASYDARDYIEHYRSEYRVIDLQEKPEILAVFNKINAVATKNSKYRPKLAIIKKEDMSVSALKDGYVIITEKTLETVYKGVSLEEGNARLAFMFGHELAHLGRDDFTFQSGVESREIVADNLGFLYAALAGYKVDYLVNESKAGHDFLTYWTKEAGEKILNDYPDPKARTENLRSQLKSSLESIKTFELGVLLANFGYYEKAIKHFKDFQKVFPSREVFNNLAYCFLMQAINMMNPHQAYYYWLPTIVDTNTLLSELSLEKNIRGPISYLKQEPNAKIQNLLEQAINYLYDSVEKDPQYAPAHTNLAIAHYYMSFQSHRQNYHIQKALEKIEIAYEMKPSLELEVLEAIILSLSKNKKEIYLNSIINLITKTSKDKNTHSSVYYNIAQLLSTESNIDKEVIEKHLEFVKNDWVNIPHIIKTIICDDKNKKSSFDCKAQKSFIVKSKPPIELPIKLGRDLLNEPFTETELEKYNLKNKKILGESIFYSEKSLYYALDEILSLAVVANSKKEDISKIALKKFNSSNIQKISLTNGTLWHYGNWAALVNGDTVEEIWLKNDS